MSLYNIVMKTSPLAHIVLTMLALVPSSVPRIRDAYASDDGHRIMVLTRSGGGNREHYKEKNDYMREHPQFVHDFDDAVDDTFALFVYDTPTKYLDDLSILTRFLAEHGAGEQMRGPAAMVRCVKEGRMPPIVNIDDTAANAAADAYLRIIQSFEGQRPSIGETEDGQK